MNILKHRSIFANCCNLGAILGFAVVAGMAVNADAQVIYNSIPSPLPLNVASVGPEAYQFREFGDGLIFTPGSPRLVTTVKVVMSDWACTSGHWYNPIGNPDSCVTSPVGATFSQPVTLNIYAVNPSAPPSAGALLATRTTTFQIPYRPSSSPQCAAAPFNDGTAWYDAGTNTCYHGVAVPITFDLTSLHVSLPDQVIVGISYNTTHYGPNPIGEATACFAAGNNCPYDSLNISADGPGAIVGQNIDPTSIFANWILPGNSCDGVVGIMQADIGGCWAANHPQIEVDTAPSGAYQIRYASNLNIGDSVINISNTGTLSGADPAGRICVNVYTYDPAEELISCCACMVTPNGLNSLSTVSDLISNPLTLGVPTSVVIKLVATVPNGGTCNAGGSSALAPGLVAWGTTLHANATTGGYNSTEGPFLTAVLSASELDKTISSCNFIQTNGSGFGICKSCRNMGLGSSKY